jgi:hypothetical protein
MDTSAFALPFQPSFNGSAEAVSHTRSLKFLKGLMDGPYFDLETIWDEHTYYEFADRSVEHTMSTMVQEPYVNHVPTVSRLEKDVCWLNELLRANQIPCFADDWWNWALEANPVLPR